MFYSQLSIEEKRKLRKDQQKEKKEIKQARKQEITKECANEIQRINNQLHTLQLQISSLENKIKTANSQQKKKLIIQLNDLKWNSSLLHAEKCTYDIEFNSRNSVKTKMCDKVNKGKECKYEDCWFAHSPEEIRIPKCIPNLFGCCTNGNLCKYDHSDTPLPNFPKRIEYSYSLTEEEQSVAFELWRNYFKHTLLYYFGEHTQLKTEEIINTLMKLETKDIVSLILSDRLFKDKVEQLYNITS